MSSSVSMADNYISTIVARKLLETAQIKPQSIYRNTNVAFTVQIRNRLSSCYM